jgi:hypothetical protein
MELARTNFRFDLPGPAWLTELLVSCDEAKELIRPGARVSPARFT